jgi:hypothetical protein
LDRHFLHVALDDMLVELREGQGRRTGMTRRTLKHIEQEDEQQRDNDPESEIAKIVHGRPFLGPIQRQAADQSLT